MLGLMRAYGFRYQNSVGSARKVVRLLKEYGEGVRKSTRL